MDARLDPAKYAGLSEGDAHVIRNAGGRASDDAIRSLVISYKLLGTAEWFVIHHTDCGMEFFTDEVIRDLLASSLETAALGPEGFYDVGDGPGSAEAANIDWLSITDQTGSVADDVRRIRNHPLVPDEHRDLRLSSTTSAPDASSRCPRPRASAAQPSGSNHEPPVAVTGGSVAVWSADRRPARFRPRRRSGAVARLGSSRAAAPRERRTSPTGDQRRRSRRSPA